MKVNLTETSQKTFIVGNKTAKHAHCYSTIDRVNMLKRKSMFKSFTCEELAEQVRKACKNENELSLVTI